MFGLFVLDNKKLFNSTINISRFLVIFKEHVMVFFSKNYFENTLDYTKFSKTKKLFNL